MAITAKIRSYSEREEKMEKKERLTPELIRDRLFYFRDAAHFYHQETKGGWEHHALGKLYDGISDYQDDIPEKIMGYMGGKRLGKLNRIQVPEYQSAADSMKLAKDLIDFAYEVYEWAGDHKFCDVENKAQELSGLAAKTVYRLTLQG
jgi:hypothetical protein